MNDLRINEGEIGLLRELANRRSISIIWDLDAFYFNCGNDTYKLECKADGPEGGDEYDEIVFCRFGKLEQQIDFHESETGFWYKIIEKETQLEEIKIIDVIQIFPGDFLIEENELSKYSDGVNFVSLGCLLRTKEGWLPAFALPSNFGFQWQEQYTFYVEEEVYSLLESEVKKFELRTI